MDGTPLFVGNVKDRVILLVRNACVHCGWKLRYFAMRRARWTAQLKIKR
jgi:hypothetical protein